MVLWVAWAYAGRALPEPREVPTLDAWFVDEAGAHRLSLDDPDQRAVFEAACRRHLGDDARCDVRRVRACQPGSDGLDGLFPPEDLWNGAPACDRATLVLVPARARLDGLHPGYAPDHAAHAAARLGEGPAALWVLVPSSRRLPDRDEMTFVVLNVAVDPWALRILGRRRVGAARVVRDF